MLAVQPLPGIAVALDSAHRKTAAIMGSRLGVAAWYAQHLHERGLFSFSFDARWISGCASGMQEWSVPTYLGRVN